MNPEKDEVRIALLDISDMLAALHQMLVADHHEIIKLRTRLDALENPAPPMPDLTKVGIFIDKDEAEMIGG